MKDNRAKMAIVVVCLLAAGALLAWRMGWIGGGTPGGPASPSNAVPTTPATVEEAAVNPGGLKPLTKDKF